MASLARLRPSAVRLARAKATSAAAFSPALAQPLGALPPSRPSRRQLAAFERDVDDLLSGSSAFSPLGLFPSLMTLPFASLIHNTQQRVLHHLHIPPLRVREDVTSEEYVLSAELPGLCKDDVIVECDVAASSITIAIEKSADEPLSRRKQSAAAATAAAAAPSPTAPTAAADDAPAAASLSAVPETPLTAAASTVSPEGSAPAPPRMVRRNSAYVSSGVVLPSDADVEHAVVHFKDGLLSVHVPRSAHIAHPGRTRLAIQ